MDPSDLTRRSVLVRDPTMVRCVMKTRMANVGTQRARS